MAEVHKRFRIFSESLELVRSTNRKGLPYRLGINRMASLTASVPVVPIFNARSSASRTLSRFSPVAALQASRT